MPEQPESAFHHHESGFYPQVEASDVPVARSSVLVAADDPKLREEMIAALESAGFVTQSAANGAQVLDVLKAALASDPKGPLPEVLVVDVAFPYDPRLELLAVLEERGCEERLVVVIPSSWPRGDEPKWLEDIPNLHEPSPMSLFVEEVARLASPRSIRTGNGHGVAVAS